MPPPRLLLALAAAALSAPPPLRAAPTTAAFASVRAASLRGDAAVAAGRAAKSPRNPLLVQDQPWERRIDNGYPNVDIVDAASGALRLWYGLCLGAVSNASACSPQGLAYAESADGLAFVKPDLGLFNLSAMATLPPFLRALGAHNNLLMVGGGLGVARDGRVAEGAPGAFRAFGEGCFEAGGGAKSGGVGGGCVAGTGASADGKSWTDAARVTWPAPQRYDCHNNLFFDNEVPIAPGQRGDGNGGGGDGGGGGGGGGGDGVRSGNAVSAAGSPRWLLTTRSYDASPGGVGREISVVAGANSSFGGWPATVPVVARGNATEQLYSMITFRWLDVLLGIVMVFDAAEPTTQGRVHCRLFAQARGAESASAPFTPVGDAGADLIPLGADGDFDSHICFAAAHPFALGTAVRLYYMGGNGPHNGERNSSLGLALLRADGFASVAAPTRGAAVLENVTVSAPRLTATVDVLAAGGSVRIGARGVPGLGLADSVPLTASATDAEVAFAAGKTFAALVGQVVDFEVELAAGAIFTLGFA
jgi:hypothetical protein